MGNVLLGLSLGVYFGMALILCWAWKKANAGAPALLVVFMALVWPLTCAYGFMVLMAERKDEDDDGQP